MSDPSWPLFDLGIHEPSSTPFINPWTDVPVPRRHRESLQWWWSTRANWSPDNWSFTGAVFVDGVPAGVQDLTASNFAQLRTVKTGSWLGQQFQGRGLGKEMRAAVLHFAFEGLGAVEAYSGAFHNNWAS
jgi:RimJ/RimL family protein N-acetyltransferase